MRDERWTAFDGMRGFTSRYTKKRRDGITVSASWCRSNRLWVLASGANDDEPPRFPCVRRSLAEWVRLDAVTAESRADSLMKTRTWLLADHRADK